MWPFVSSAAPMRPGSEEPNSTKAKLQTPGGHGNLSARSEQLPARGHEAKFPTPRVSRGDLTARREQLAVRVHEATRLVYDDTSVSLFYGRLSVVALLTLELLRITAWQQGTLPGFSVFGMHFLTTSSDLISSLCAAPFYFFYRARCAAGGCVGPMLTMCFAMLFVDMCALGAYLMLASPRPLSPGAKSYVDALEACIGIWEFALFSSVALQAALCASSWRIYRCMRMMGIYPPGSDPLESGRDGVSFLEVMCEAEDIESFWSWSECCFVPGESTSRPDAEAKPTPRPGGET